MKSILTLLVLLNFSQASENVCGGEDLFGKSDFLNEVAFLQEPLSHNCDELKRLDELKLFHSYDTDFSTELEEYVNNELQNKVAGVSHNWAYEYVGLDLVLRERGEVDIENREPQPVIAILDSGFQGLADSNSIISSGKLYGDHGTHVYSMISGLGDSQIDKFIGVTNSTGFEFASNFFDVNGYPELLNSSSLYFARKSSHNGIKRLMKNKTIIIASGGNYYPDFIPQYDDLYEDIIHAGWLSSDGFIHPNSTEGNHIDLTVPVDEHAISSIKKNTFSVFGGSSAAAPFVTATIKSIVEVIGSNDINIIKPILLNSSSSYPFDVKGNGKGVLNSYKAFHVAKKIKNKCKEDLICMRNESLESRYYEFDMEENNLIQSGYKFVPSCIKNEASFYRANDCSIYELLKELRKVHLLTGDKDVAKLLSCLYKSLGFYVSGKYYEKFYMEPRELMEELIEAEPEIFLRYARHIPDLSKSDLRNQVNRLKKKFEGTYDKSSLEALVYLLESKEYYNEFLPDVLDLLGKVEHFDETVSGNLNTDAVADSFTLKSTDFNIKILLSDSSMLKNIGYFLIKNNYLGVSQLQTLMCFDYKQNLQKGYVKLFRETFPKRYNMLFRDGLGIMCQNRTELSRE